MEFRELLEKRRSVRKYSDRKVERDVVDSLIDATLTAPSARNTRSTKLIIVESTERIVKMAQMRDYGSSFMKNAPLAIVVMGERGKSDVWRENSAISATILQLACVDRGLVSCWVQADGRPRLKSEPQGEQVDEYLRSLLPIPEECSVLCIIAIGYSAFEPASLPAFDREDSVIWAE